MAGLGYRRRARSRIPITRISFEPGSTLPLHYEVLDLEKAAVATLVITVERHKVFHMIASFKPQNPVTNTNLDAGNRALMLSSPPAREGEPPFPFLSYRLDGYNGMGVPIVFEFDRNAPPALRLWMRVAPQATRAARTPDCGLSF